MQLLINVQQNKTLISSSQKLYLPNTVEIPRMLILIQQHANIFSKNIFLGQLKSGKQWQIKSIYSSYS